MLDLRDKEIGFEYDFENDGITIRMVIVEKRIVDGSIIVMSRMAV